MALNSLLRAFGLKSAPPTKKIRIAVVGAGRMGQLHLQKLARHPGASLIGIVDSNMEQARKLAKRWRVAAFSDVSGIVRNVEAAIVATPTRTHFAIGKALMESGVSCLIEKPIAPNLDDASRLIEIAEREHRILQIGHIERFNPAVMEAARHIREPRFLEVNRLGPYDPRVADIGVVLDLMIHDLDMVLFLVNSEVTRVEAVGAKVLSNHEDIAKVRLHFANGCIADLSASRVSLEKYRKFRVFQSDAYISIDYAASKLKIYKRKSEIVKALSDVIVMTPKLVRRDALSLELDHFLECVRENRDPMVSGRHGRDALALAKEVLDHLEVHA